MSSSSLTVATWNVNGIRAREAQVLDWLTRDQPDVFCLQELKAATAQVPLSLAGLGDYWLYWHGAGGYSGVAIGLRKEAFPDPPHFAHPSLDFETRIVTAEAGGLLLASIYVPNGGKDYEAKLRFLAALDEYAEEMRATGRTVVLCGDLNVARTDQDVHPKERKAGVVGQRPDEREIFSRLVERGLVDVGRTLDPENEELFTWWPPWRSMRQRNIGWRIDYILASQGLAESASASRVLADFGTSDHAPVVATFAR
jgi:exodeoxyribonuclease-3